MLDARRSGGIWGRSRYVLRRACTGPTEQEARKPMFLGGLYASAGVSDFRAGRRACTGPTRPTHRKLLAEDNVEKADCSGPPPSAFIPYSSQTQNQNSCVQLQLPRW